MGTSSLANHLSGKERESGASTSGFGFVLFLFGCMESWLQHAGSLIVACRVSFPDRDANLDPLLWECQVLTTGPPGKSLCLVLSQENTGAAVRLTMSCGEEGSYSQWFSKMCKSGEIS